MRLGVTLAVLILFLDFALTDAFRSQALKEKAAKVATTPAELEAEAEAQLAAMVCSLTNREGCISCGS